MIFNQDVDHSLTFLNQDLCKYYPADVVFFVEEKTTSGNAKIAVTSPLPCIHVRDVDNNRYSLTRLAKCADHIILKYDPVHNIWDLHIIELKRTISKTKWENTIIAQFHGALINAFALCGVLHIPSQDIRDIYLHCGYRRNSSSYSLADQKIFLGSSAKDSGGEWLSKPIMLDYLPNRLLYNQAIKLDEATGTAVYNLTSSSSTE